MDRVPEPELMDLGTGPADIPLRVLRASPQAHALRHAAHVATLARAARRKDIQSGL